MKENDRYKDGRVLLKVGDITEENVQAVVHAANSWGLMDAGVAKAIVEKGGKKIEREAMEKGPTPVGEACITRAGRLPARWVIHASVMRGTRERTDPEKVYRATVASLRLADEFGLKSIAFPGLGTGTGRVPFAEAAAAMVRAICEHLEGEKSLREVRLVDRNAAFADACARVLDSCSREREGDKAREIERKEDRNR
jgi:O-acetyl-ADP-ribose deacetylase (regulator of RNase III)